MFGPAKGDGNVWYYDEPDLAPFLHAGGNTVAVSLLACPEDTEKGNHSLFRFDRPRLFLNGLMPDGWRCRTEHGVEFPREEERFAPLQIHEQAVGDPKLCGWKSPEYDDSLWDSALICPEDSLPGVLRPDLLSPRPIPVMERKLPPLQNRSLSWIRGRRSALSCIWRPQAGTVRRSNFWRVKGTSFRKARATDATVSGDIWRGTETSTPQQGQKMNAMSLTGSAPSVFCVLP